MMLYSGAFCYILCVCYLTCRASPYFRELNGWPNSFRGARCCCISCTGLQVRSFSIFLSFRSDRYRSWTILNLCLFDNLVAASPTQTSKQSFVHQGWNAEHVQMNGAWASYRVSCACCLRGCGCLKLTAKEHLLRINGTVRRDHWNKGRETSSIQHIK